MSRMMPAVKIKSSMYLNTAAETDDLYQEGLIGLMYAIRSFSDDRGTRFRTYADVCVENKILSAIKSAHRQKNIPLNSYVPLSDVDFSVADDKLTPEQLLIANENYVRLSEFIDNNLSLIEKEVIRLYLGGYSYEYMAQKLGSTTKSVDNALQRVRRKLRSFAKSL